jgi:hypothetical protein
LRVPRILSVKFCENVFDGDIELQSRAL